MRLSCRSAPYLESKGPSSLTYCFSPLLTCRVKLLKGALSAVEQIPPKLGSLKPQLCYVPTILWIRDVGRVGLGGSSAQCVALGVGGLVNIHSSGSLAGAAASRVGPDPPCRLALWAVRPCTWKLLSKSGVQVGEGRPALPLRLP